MNYYPKPTLFIDGQEQGGTSGSLEIVNPATERVIGALSLASSEAIEQAIEAAGRGFGTWSGIAANERGQMLLQSIEDLSSSVERIATILTLENGKPLREARDEVITSIKTLNWFANEARRRWHRCLEGNLPGSQFTVDHRPIGVVAAFTPWNFPILTAVRKIAPALAAGCAVIIKPAEETPAAVCEFLKTIGRHIPRGVINILFGEPELVSSRLIRSASVKKVSLTGSTAVGRKVALLAAENLKPLTLELGGHAPVIVDKSVNPEQVAKIIAAGKFRASGQICTAPSRLYIHKDVYHRFLEEFTGFARELKVGNGLDLSTNMGPLINLRRLEQTDLLVKDALSRGAHLRTGGGRVRDCGYFYAPTVLEEVPAAADILRSEPFGPVATAASFDDLDCAIAQANNTPFGLAGYVFSQEVDQARAIAARLEIGVVGINSCSVSAPHVPFGGRKASGYGVEGGDEAIASYMVPVTTHQMLL